MSVQQDEYIVATRQLEPEAVESYKKEISKANAEVARAIQAHKGKVEPNIRLFGIGATSIQLQYLGFQNEFFVKTSYSYINKEGKEQSYYKPYRCEKKENGLVTAIKQEKVKDADGNYIKNQNGNFIWEDSTIYDDGLKHLLIESQGRNNPNLFIIPNHTRGLQKSDVYGTGSVFVEIDNCSIKQQWQTVDDVFQATGLQPSLIVFSGGKSLHIYYSLAEISTNMESWERVQRKLICIFQSDTAICNLNREMRLAGVYRSNKSTFQEVQFVSAAQYSSLHQIEKRLDSLGLFPYGLSESRWKKYNSARRKGVSNEELEIILKQPEDALYPQTQKLERSNRTNSKYEWVGNNNSTQIPLEAFIGKEKQSLLSGVGAGQRDQTLTELAGYLVGLVEKLNYFGIPHSNDAESLLINFCRSCTPPLEDAYAQSAWHRMSQKGGNSPLTEEYLRSRQKNWLWNYNRDEYYKSLIPKKELPQDFGTPKPAQDYDSPVAIPQKETWEQSLERKTKEIQTKISTLTIKPEYRLIVSTNKFLGAKFPDSGLCLLPVPMKAGKTYSIKQKVEEDLERPVIVIAATVGLAIDIATNLNLEFRNDLKVEGIDTASMLAQYHRVVVCSPSLHQIGQWLDKWLHKSPIVIFDEAEEQFNFLIDSNLCDKAPGKKSGVRADNLKQIARILSSAKKYDCLVMMADANLSNRSVNFARAYAPDLPVTVFTWNGQVILPKIFYTTKRGFVDTKVRTLLQQGKKVWIGGDSQNETEALDKALFQLTSDAVNDGTKIIRVDSETSNNPEVLEILQRTKTTYTVNGQIIRLENRNRSLAKHEYQCFIHTSTMGSGVSVEFTQEIFNAYQSLFKAEELGDIELINQAVLAVADAEKNWDTGTPYFQERFIYNAHLDAQMILQFIGRYRFPINTYIWCGRDLPISGCKSHLPDQHTKTLLTQIEDLAELHNEAKTSLPAMLQDDAVIISQTYSRLVRQAAEGMNPIINLRAENRARRCFLLEDRAKKLKQFLVDKAYEVVDVEDEEEDGLTDLIKAIKEEKKERIARKTVESELISENGAKKLQNKERLTEDERCSLNRYFLELAAPGLLNAIKECDRILFYRQGFMEMGGKLIIQGHRNYQNYLDQDILRQSDVNKFVSVINKVAETGVDSFHDLAKVKSGFYKFVRDWGLFNLFDLNNPEKLYCSADFEKFIKDSFKNTKIRNQIKAYFGKSQPKEMFAKFICSCLEKFGFTLVESIKNRKASGKYYKLERQMIHGMSKKELEKMMSIFEAQNRQKHDTELVPTMLTPTGKTKILPEVVASPSSHTTNSEVLQESLPTIAEQKQAAMAAIESLDIDIFDCFPEPETKPQPQQPETVPQQQQQPQQPQQETRVTVNRYKNEWFEPEFRVLELLDSGYATIQSVVTGEVFSEHQSDLTLVR